MSKLAFDGIGSESQSQQKYLSEHIYRSILIAIDRGYKAQKLHTDSILAFLMSWSVRKIEKFISAESVVTHFGKKRISKIILFEWLLSRVPKTLPRTVAPMSAIINKHTGMISLFWRYQERL